jgi:1,4-dihydroxy-2-naphthoate octaprenyltransferase
MRRAPRNEGAPVSDGLLDTHRPADSPSPALAGPGLAAAVRRAFLATRPPFLIASASPVAVGTAWAGAAFHRFDGLMFGLALAIMLLAHAAANVYNDVGDDITGADPGNDGRIYPYTGGSRFIQSGLLSRAQMTRLAAGLAAAALLLGALLAVLRGPGVIWLGCAGLALGLLYSLPGVQLSARGLGEATVAIGFGALPVLGSVWLQTGFVDLGAALLCVPVSAWAAAILIINEVPDIDADRRAQKRTLVVRWGVRGARWIYRGLVVIALGASAAAIAERVLPLWYALPAVAFAAIGLHSARGISANGTKRPQLKRSIELTLAIHALGCITLITAILLNHNG